MLALPATIDELHAGLQPKFRRNLRVAEDRLRRTAPSSCPRQPQDTAEFMRALFRLHAARWQERSEPGMLADGRAATVPSRCRRAPGHARPFCGCPPSACAARSSRCSTTCGATTACIAYLSGFDPAHARNSPGAALLAFAIRSALEEGATEIDFLRKREEFKYQWGARDRVNRRLILSHSAADVRDVA